MNRKEAGILVGKIAALWPQFRIIEKVTIDAWYEVFQNESASLANEAVLNFAKNSSHGFPPSPPELMRSVREIRRQRALRENNKNVVQGEFPRSQRTREERAVWMNDLLRKYGL